jgi:uncharacterized membrane protein
MSSSPILLVHILAGTAGLLSGTAALCFRKGSRRHALAGKIFVASRVTWNAGNAPRSPSYRDTYGPPKER